ncbi:MAG: cellulase family glycosylhydrolase [Mycobacterium sp.]|nr:cellulase family glycosylhydrolase [Mycobacterium sp.]
MLAFGINPLCTAPAARADDFGLGDVIGNLLSDAVTATNSAGDIVGDSSQAGGQTVAELSSQSLDQALTATSSAQSVDALFQQYVYDPIHTAIQDWINSPLGEQVDATINTASGQFLIGDGANGTSAHPDGYAGGLLLGDGGNGWDASSDPGVAGGAGGSAGGFFGDGGYGGDGGAGADGGAGGAGGSEFGIGGDGGNGGDGAVGGAGGDGGDSGSVFGIGGDGGKGGDSSDSGVLAALGGAGGTSGALGNHGMVGDFGTVAAGSGTGTGGSLLSIGTTGDWLTNSDGQVVILHGLNETYKEAPYEPAADGFDNQDAAFLAANGFNVVRVGVIWSELEPDPGVYNTAYLDSIENTVQTLGNNGIYSILDFHQDAYGTEFGGEGAPAWATETDGATNVSLPFPYNEFFDPAETQAWDSFWSNAESPNGAGLEDNYSQMLEYVANAFKGNSDVTGFEIMNEPSAGSQTLSTLLGSSFFDSQELTPFYDQAADAIRAVDPSTPIFYEPDVLFSAGVPTHLGTVDASGTVFSFHDYCEFNLGPLGCFPNVDTLADNALAYANAQGIPAFMTEFGASSDQSSLDASMQTADQHLIGWTEWAYSGQGDITTTANPPSSESLVYNPELPPTGSNVNTANLDTLAEPYPQEISGTPDSYSFNNGTFQFTYSTEEADGLGSFPTGSHTTISVPSVEYPDGYQVTVTGGEVISPANASELVIESNSGASTITVTVSPT